MKLKEYMINEMARNYSIKPGTTQEQELLIKNKMKENIQKTLKDIQMFQNKVRELSEDYQSFLIKEVDKIQDEETIRYGPYQALSKIKAKFTDIIISLEKAKQTVADSQK